MSLPTDKDEQATRKEIDEKLISADWMTRDKKQPNLHQSLSMLPANISN